MLIIYTTGQKFRVIIILIQEMKTFRKYIYIAQNRLILLKKCLA